MKKFLSVFTTLVLAAALAVPVCAEEYHPSVEAESAPVLVTTKEAETNREIIGYVVDEHGEVCSTEYKDCIIVTPLADVAEAENLSAETKAIMAEFYNGILSGEISLDDCPELVALVKEKLGENAKASDLVIKDLFDVTVVCDVLNKNLPPEGTTITLTFDIDLPADSEIFVVTYKNGEIVLVEDMVNNGDGTVSATFEDFCPVAFLVPQDVAEVIGDGGVCAICNGKFVYKASPIPAVCLTCFIIIVAIIGAGVGGVYAYMKNKAKKEETK